MKEIKEIKKDAKPEERPQERNRENMLNFITPSGPMFPGDIRNIDKMNDDTGRVAGIPGLYCG